MVNFSKNSFILSAIALLCVACGVRGPLTVNPAPVKGISPDVAVANDLRASPSANVLHGANGTKTYLPAPPAPNTQP
jgi:hypothetical protein